MKTIIQFSLFIIVFCVCLLVQSNYLIIAITVFAVVFNVGAFIKERNELKRASFYCRTTNTSKFQILLTSAIVIVGLLMFFLIQKASLKFLNSETNLFIAINIFFNTFGNLYGNFNNSIRSFKNGIVLPLFRKKLTPWTSINSIELINTKLIVTLENNNVESFQIDKRDSEDALNIIAQFKQKSS